MSHPLINLVVVGHKDHGKSTLIGRLLHDSKALPEQKLQEIKNELKESGREFQFAFLLDSLEEERDGGLSIDIIQTPFKSNKFFYTIIDCPGHKEFIKKMLTGASQADAALLLVSAKEGVQDQTKEHAFLIKTFGIQQLVVAINKMDEVAYNRNRYTTLCKLMKNTLVSLGYKKTPMIPISALHGDNIFSASKKMEWYDGLPLIDTLDNTIKPSALPVNKPLRGFVQDTYPYDGDRIIICKIETGVLESGKRICFNPSGKLGITRAITIFGAEISKAEPGDSVGLLVDGVHGVERGEVISYPENKPLITQNFVAKIILFPGTEILEGNILKIRYGTAEKECAVHKILKKIDPVTLTIQQEFPESLQKECVGEVKLVPLQPLCIEKYSELPQMGRFVIEGKKGTSAAGIVLKITEV